MAEATNTSPVAQSTIVANATETAAKQAGFQEKAQADLERMSGSELAEYFAAQKAQTSGKSAQKAASNVTKAPTKAPDPIKEAAAAATEAVRKHKLKVDGEEIEVDDDELKRGYAHQKAANKRLQEGLAARKQAEEFVSMMRDPEKFYDTAKRLGHDPRKLAEEYLARQLEDELLDPRDKELRDAKARLKHIEDMENLEKENIVKQRNEVLKQKYAKDYSDQFVSALQDSGLPPTKPMVAEMAKYVARASKIGFKMTPSEAAQLVKEDIQVAHQRLIGDADGDLLIKLLGDEVANKVRKYDTQRLKNPETNLKTPTEQGEPRARSKPSGRRMTSKEWREYNRK